MAKNSKIFWNYERPTRGVGAVILQQGMAVVLDNNLGGENNSVPKYKLPTTGVAIDGIAVTRCRVAGEMFDLTSENDKFVPGMAAATFGTGVELAVNSSGKFITAIAAQMVVAKSITGATAADQVVTIQRVAPYAKA